MGFLDFSLMCSVDKVSTWCCYGSIGNPLKWYYMLAFLYRHGCLPIKQMIFQVQQTVEKQHCIALYYQHSIALLLCSAMQYHFSGTANSRKTALHSTVLLAHHSTTTMQCYVVPLKRYSKQQKNSTAQSYLIKSIYMNKIYQHEFEKKTNKCFLKHLTNCCISCVVFHLPLGSIISLTFFS